MALDQFTARHDGQVKAVMAHGPFGLIVLAGGHDLAESVRRLSGGSCIYLRIASIRFREVVENDRAHRNPQGFYNRLQPQTRFFRGEWNSPKCKNPGFSGVFCVCLFP